jgi:hypothetical protein
MCLPSYNTNQVKIKSVRKTPKLQEIQMNSLYYHAYTANNFEEKELAKEWWKHSQYVLQPDLKI